MPSVRAVAGVLALSTAFVTGCSADVDGPSPDVAQLTTGWTELDEPVALPESDRLDNLLGDRGGVQVLNIWATWCGPCREEIPVLQRAATRGHVGVVGVSTDVDARAATDFLEREGATYPNWVDSSGDLVTGLGDSLRVAGYPFSLAIADGEVRAVHAGAFDDVSEVEDAVDLAS